MPHSTLSIKSGNRPKVGPSLSLEGCNVLVVDDSRDIRRLLQQFVVVAGGRPILTDNGEEAVAVALTREFDVVLMDIQMPGISGHEATRQLRAAGYRRPILALTASSSMEEQQRCIDSGFNACLTKPIERQALYVTILNLSTCVGEAGA